MRPRKRAYRVIGGKTPDQTDGWTDVTDESDLDAAWWRFFEVKAETK